MFERYNDRARRVIRLADAEARSMRHDAVGTEHLLVALIAEGEGVAFAALDALGVTLDAAREVVFRHHPDGNDAVAGHLPLTPHLKKVLELALREALNLSMNFIGTEHLLLGLVRDWAATGTGMLPALGISPEDARDKVLELLRGYARQERASLASCPAAGRGELAILGG